MNVHDLRVPIEKSYTKPIPIDFEVMQDFGVEISSLSAPTDIVPANYQSTSSADINALGISVSLNDPGKMTFT